MKDTDIKVVIKYVKEKNVLLYFLNQLTKLCHPPLNNMLECTSM